MGKKFMNLNQYMSVVTDTDEKQFMVFEHTINHHSFGYVCYPSLNTVFLVLHLFLTSFSLLLLRLFTFKPLNPLYSKFERLKISGRNFV